MFRFYDFCTTIPVRKFCLPKSQRYASSVPFNVIKLFNFLVNDLGVFKLD